MGYIKGKNLLLKLGEGCIGKCTEHTITYTTGTTDIAVKPAADEAPNESNFKTSLIDSQEISGSFKGLRAENETESGFEQLVALWGAGKPVPFSAFKRAKDTAPYLKGECVITSLVETNGADGIAEYNGDFKVNGTPEIYPGMPESGGESGKQQAPVIPES